MITATFREVPLIDDGAGISGLRINDTVRIHTHSGETLQFELVSIEHDVLAGADQRIQMQDIANVEVERLNKRGLFITLGSIAAALLVIEQNRCDDPGTSIYSPC